VDAGILWDEQDRIVLKRLCADLETFNHNFARLVNEIEKFKAEGVTLKVAIDTPAVVTFVQKLTSVLDTLTGKKEV